MKQLMYIFQILLFPALLWSHFSCAQDKQLRITSAYYQWMQKPFLDSIKKYPPDDPYWQTADFTRYFAPVAMLKIYERVPGKQDIHIYAYGGVDGFPAFVTSTAHLPGRKEWLISTPVFAGKLLNERYNGATFSLISHNNDPKDLWIGIQYKDGRRDSIQLAELKNSDASIVWLNVGEYVNYRLTAGRFDVFDSRGRLLHKNVQFGKDNALSGFKGYSQFYSAIRPDNRRVVSLVTGPPGGEHNYTLQFNNNDIHLYQRSKPAAGGAQSRPGQDSLRYILKPAVN